MELAQRNGFAFEWQVAVGRYQILSNGTDGWHHEVDPRVIDIAREDDPFVDIGPAWIGLPEPFRGYRMYAPLEECRGLHRSFAALPWAGEERDAAAVFEQYRLFANRYGLLTATGMLRRSRDGEPDPDWNMLADSVALWDQEVRWFRGAICVWDCLRSDHARLGQLIVWSKDGKSVSYREPERRWLGRRSVGVHVDAIASPTSGADLLRNWRPFDVVQPALYWLTSAINRGLANRVSPQLSSSDPPRVSFHPDNLLTAMRVMLFLEVSGQSDLRQCHHCNGWFDALGKRADARYCSTSCKNMASRARKNPS